MAIQLSIATKLLQFLFSFFCNLATQTYTLMALIRTHDSDFLYKHTFISGCVQLQQCENQCPRDTCLGDAVQLRLLETFWMAMNRQGVSLTCYSQLLEWQPHSRKASYLTCTRYAYQVTAICPYLLKDSQLAIATTD